MRLSQLTVSKIKEIAKDPENMSEELLNEIKNDRRRGVQQIYKKIKNDKNKNSQLTEQLNVMLEYEKELKNQGCHYIAGVDEAGRGPLAGPVVAGAVILPDNAETILGINDSKQLTSKQRVKLAEKIKNSFYHGIGLADVNEIDQYNIHVATLIAIKRAIENLPVKPDALLCDSVKIDMPLQQLNLVRGDTKSISIAAASIIAKVYRDKLMVEYHDKYPVYDFKNNKGYGTAKHRDSLEKYGPCPIHRTSYKPVKELVK